MNLSGWSLRARLERAMHPGDFNFPPEMDRAAGKMLTMLWLVSLARGSSREGLDHALSRTGLRVLSDADPEASHRAALAVRAPAGYGCFWSARDCVHAGLADAYAESLLVLRTPGTLRLLERRLVDGPWPLLACASALALLRARREGSLLAFPQGIALRGGRVVDPMFAASVARWAPRDRRADAWMAARWLVIAEFPREVLPRDDRSLPLLRDLDPQRMLRAIVLAGEACLKELRAVDIQHVRAARAS